MAIRYLLMSRRYLGLFPGEVAAWEDPKFSQMVEGGYGIECDKDGVPLEPGVAIADSSGSASDPNSDDSNSGDTEGDYKFDEKTDPFIVDGLSKTSSQKLHNAGLHTPDDVRKYLQDGKSLADLSVSATDCRKAASLYVQPQ